MEIIAEDWGLVDYTEAYQRQRVVVNDVIATGRGRLIFCEHPPIVTLGRLFKEGSLLFTQEQIKQRGAAIETVDRGGDATLHAPGQLVVYVILNLNLYGRNLKSYLEKLQQAAVDLLKDFGILAVGIPGQRGVFVPRPSFHSSKGSRSSMGYDKIVSIGIGVRKWVSYHGVGINVNPDLSLFSFIKPCGLDVQMTSMAQLLGHPLSMGEVKHKWIEFFSKIFKVNILQ